MKLNNIIFIYLWINLLISLKFKIVKEKNKRYLREKNTRLITEDNILCLKKDIREEKMKSCLKKLNINNYNDAKTLIHTIIVNDLDNLKAKTKNNKKIVSSKVYHYLNNLEDIFSQNKIDYQKYNDLLIKFNSKIKNNKLILRSLNNIKKYLNKIVIIKDVFTNESLKKYQDIKKDFSYDLQNTQKMNENLVMNQKKKLEENISDHMKNFNENKIKNDKKDHKENIPKIKNKTNSFQFKKIPNINKTNHLNVDFNVTKETKPIQKEKIKNENVKTETKKEKENKKDNKVQKSKPINNLVLKNNIPDKEKNSKKEKNDNSSKFINIFILLKFYIFINLI